MFEACGQSQQAQDVLTAASNASLPLTIDLYNAALRCCILQQHGERAIEIWEEMQVCHMLNLPSRSPALLHALKMQWPALSDTQLAADMAILYQPIALCMYMPKLLQVMMLIEA